MSETTITISDEYDGDPARREVQRFTASGVDVYKTSVGEMSNNVYLLVRGGEGLLVDAADEADHLLALIDAVGCDVRTVVTTHSHGDHVQALAEVLRATGARHLTSTLDAPDIDADHDRLLDHGDVVTFGGDDPVDMTAFILRGHTRGGVGLALDERAGDPPHLFVGDSLFPGGVGATKSGEQFEILIGDVEDRVFGAYDDSAVVHPGHGADTTVGAERPHLAEWRERGW
ncbi:MBL fold metallo-hydrolase [Corynebacterium sp. 335C]